MRPADRRAWLLDWLRKRTTSAGPERADVLNRAFVEDYVDATGARCDVMPYGADRCPQLGRDLSALAAAGQLERQRVGIQGLAGQGFPSWVWSYSLRRGVRS